MERVSPSWWYSRWSSRTNSWGRCALTSVFAGNGEDDSPFSIESKLRNFETVLSNTNDQADDVQRKLLRLLIEFWFQVSMLSYQRTIQFVYSLPDGQYDGLILTNGTLLSIQNMTWNGKLGFQEEPSKDFEVPIALKSTGFLYNYGPQGVMGKAHYERGLMWVET